MRTLSFTLLCLLSMVCFSKEIRIQGNAVGFEGKKISLSVVNDFISLQKNVIAKTDMKEDQFSLTIKLEKTQQIFLKIEDKESSFFAEPGAVYNLSLSYDEEKNQGQAYNKRLDLKFAFPKADELNQKIKAFNQAYQDFFTENYSLFAINAAQKQSLSFIEKIEQDSRFQSPEFVKQYCTYALANLKDINRLPRKELFEEYLHNKEIRYQNKEYMNFFVQYYKEDFGQYCITKKGSELLKAIMFDKDLSKSLSLIQKDKEFSQLELAELYLINGLFEVYHKRTIEQASAISMLDQITKAGQNPENKSMAKAIKQKLIFFGTQELAPEFSLLNSKNETVSLSELKGKPIYLSFWANWSIPSLRELKVMKKLHEKYGNEIHFVSINLDEDPKVMTDLKSKNDYEWPFLHYGNDYEIREKYQVKAVPSYYLIDKNGKLIQAFAPNPVEVEKTLYDLSK